MRRILWEYTHYDQSGDDTTISLVESRKSAVTICITGVGGEIEIDLNRLHATRMALALAGVIPPKESA